MKKSDQTVRKVLERRDFEDKYDHYPENLFTKEWKDREFDEDGKCLLMKESNYSLSPTFYQIIRGMIPEYTEWDRPLVYQIVLETWPYIHMDIKVEHHERRYIHGVPFSDKEGFRWYEIDQYGTYVYKKRPDHILDTKCRVCPLCGGLMVPTKEFKITEGSRYQFKCLDCYLCMSTGSLLISGDQSKFFMKDADLDTEEFHPG